MSIQQRKLLKAIYGIHAIVNTNAGLNPDGTVFVPEMDYYNED